MPCPAAVDEDGKRRRRDRDGSTGGEQPRVLERDEHAASVANARATDPKARRSGAAPTWTHATWTTNVQAAMRIGIIHPSSRGTYATASVHGSVTRSPGHDGPARAVVNMPNA